jgi:quercetin dioxygenase-like cupin family protein
LIVLAGRGLARIGRATHAIHAGQLVWHLPGVEHELVELSSDFDGVTPPITWNATGSVTWSGPSNPS